MSQEANDSPNTTDPHLLGLHRLMREKDEQISALQAKSARLRIAVEQMEAAYKLAAAERDTFKRENEALRQAMTKLADPNVVVVTNCPAHGSCVNGKVLEIARAALDAKEKK